MKANGVEVQRWPGVNRSMTGWVRFAPSFFDGPRLGETFAQKTYFFRKEGQTPSGEFEVAEDYVVCVLNRRLGDDLGWMGTRVYSEDWDGMDAFTHVGYPDEIAGGQRPSFQGQISFEDVDHPGFFETGDGLDMETEADLTKGDSGGPFLAHWDKPVPGPYIVGVTSAEGTWVLSWTIRSGRSMQTTGPAAASRWWRWSSKPWPTSREGRVARRRGGGRAAGQSDDREDVRASRLRLGPPLLFVESRRRRGRGVCSTSLPFRCGG